MKAMYKNTGEIVEIEYNGLANAKIHTYRTSDGRVLPAYALEFEKEIDWEQRRYEIAKELMKGFASNPHNQCVDASTETLAQWSVGGADALINELKKGNSDEQENQH